MDFVADLSDLEQVEAPMITHGLRWIKLIDRIGQHRLHQAKMVAWLRVYLPGGEWADKIASDLQAFNELMEELEEVMRDMAADMEAWGEFHKVQAKALQLQMQELTHTRLQGSKTDE